MATEGWSTRQDKYGVTWYCEHDGKNDDRWYKWEQVEGAAPRKVYDEPDW